jgi:hypothetical protein
MKTTNHEELWRPWRELCLKIGDRRAGSAGEQAAADYLQAQFVALGLANVHAEPFACVSVVRSVAELAVGRGGRLRPMPARVLAGSPATPRSRPVEGDLVWIEMPEQARRLLTPALRGKIVVLVGPTPTRADLHQRLVRSRPAAVIHLDDRLPFEWTKEDGVYPAWVRRYGMPPIVAAPFRLGWEWRKAGLDRARIRIVVELRQATSQTVVADIPGRRPQLPVVLLGAHHDTQCDNMGADDNASGVVALLALAAGLAGIRPLRTIRFASFGAEEQLSVGSAAYVRQHRAQMRSMGVVLNLDSVASVLGHHWLIRAGSARFGAWLLAQLWRGGLEATEHAAPMPFADHFPFSVFGVPAVTLYRPNMDAGMRWQHHSVHDNLDNVSARELWRVVQALRGVVLKLAGLPHWPFRRALAPEQRHETARLARDLYGLRG